MEVAEIEGMWVEVPGERPRFNEAAIWRSRKFIGGGRVRGRGPASMRPRYGGRGNPAPVYDHFRPSSGFNEAAIWRSRKSSVTVHHFERRIASMRPRYGGRGNRCEHSHSDVDDGASMRPRYGGRGNFRTREHKDRFSYRFNEAAIWRSRKSAEEAYAAGIVHGFNEAAIWRSRK